MVLPHSSPGNPHTREWNQRGTVSHSLSQVVYLQVQESTDYLISLPMVEEELVQSTGGLNLNQENWVLCPAQSAPCQLGIGLHNPAP